MNGQVLESDLVKLTSKIDVVFYTLINDKKFNFIKKELKGDFSLEDGINELKELDTLNSLPMIELRDNMSGNEFSVYVLSIENNTINVLSTLDDSIYNVMFTKISSLVDKIRLISIIEAY